MNKEIKRLEKLYSKLAGSPQSLYGEVFASEVENSLSDKLEVINAKSRFSMNLVYLKAFVGGQNFRLSKS